MNIGNKIAAAISNLELEELKAEKFILEETLKYINALSRQGILIGGKFEIDYGSKNLLLIDEPFTVLREEVEHGLGKIIEMLEFKRIARGE